MHEFVRFMIVGIVASWCASILARGRIVYLRGCLPFLVLGIGGSLAGGYLSRIFLSDSEAVIVAGVVSVTLLVLLRLSRR